MLRQRQSSVQIMSLSDPSTRIALAALLHDIGKLAERAAELDYRAVRAWLAHWKETLQRIMHWHLDEYLRKPIPSSVNFATITFPGKFL